VATIEKSLLDQDGVIKASVNLLEQKATVEYDSSKVDRDRLEGAVEASGYRPKRDTITLTLDATPSNPEWDTIEARIGNVTGVITARGVRGRPLVLIEYDEILFEQRAARKVLAELGYTVVEDTSSEQRKSLTRVQEIRYYRNLLVMSIILTVPTTLIMFNVITPFIPAFIDLDILMFLLVTPIQFIGGYPFYKSSLRGLAHRKTNMDTLIMLGTSAAYFYSVFATFALTGFMVFCQGKDIKCNHCSNGPPA
jgi:Cu+-exporting ATPase